MTIPIKHREGDVLVEVLPLDQSIGKHLANALDKTLHDVVVRFASQPWFSVPQIARIVQEIGVVGAQHVHDCGRGLGS